MGLPLSREEFEAIYSRVPRVNVEVIVKTNEGIVLTLRSMDPEVGKWHIPGGTIFFKERVEEAVKRVALDELGVEVEIVKPLGHIEYPNIRGYFGWPIGLVFVTTIISGTLKGSAQGEKIEVFDRIPENIVFDQGVFLERIWAEI